MRRCVVLLCLVAMGCGKDVPGPLVTPKCEAQRAEIEGILKPLKPGQRLAMESWITPMAYSAGLYADCAQQVALYKHAMRTPPKLRSEIFASLGEVLAKVPCPEASAALLHSLHTDVPPQDRAAALKPLTHLPPKQTCSMLTAALGSPVLDANTALPDPAYRGVGRYRFVFAEVPPEQHTLLAWAMLPMLQDAPLSEPARATALDLLAQTPADKRLSLAMLLGHGPLSDDLIHEVFAQPNHAERAARAMWLWQLYALNPET